MAQFVTLAEAFTHLRLNGYFVLGSSPVDARETDLQLKLDGSEAIVLDYIKSYDALVDSQLPLLKAAILLQLGELWRFRGDDIDGQTAPVTAGDLSPVVTNILRRFRDPALA